MLELTISPELKAVVGRVAVGCITAGVQVAAHDERLWAEIETAAARFRGTALADARRLPPMKALRDAYRTLGNDPTRYRGSNEAIVRRITQGKDLYHVNTVVDVNNLVTLETLHSAGTFDLDRLQPPIEFRIGQPAETYAGIGRGQIKIERLPVFADRSGPFGSTTSDSERTKVGLATTRIMTVVISFLGPDGMDRVVDRAVGLLEEYSSAAVVETTIVQ